MHLVRTHLEVATGRQRAIAQQPRRTDQHIIGRADAAAAQLQVTRAADDEIAGRRKRRAGMPHARTLVGDQQLDPPARERPARRDIDGQPQRPARPRAAVGDPRVQVVGGRHAGIDLRPAVARDDAHAAVGIGEAVLHRARHAHLLGDQLQVQHRPGQAARADVDGAGAGIEHHVALQLAGARGEVVERHLARGQRHVARVGERTTVHRDAVRVGDDHVGARPQHGDVALDQRRVGAGDLVDDGAGADGGVVQVGAHRAYVEGGVGVVGDACGAGGDVDHGAAVGACGDRGGGAAVWGDAGGDGGWWDEDGVEAEERGQLGRAVW
ncbi:hypothetical protein GO292_04901 [Ralstonia solanacearum]|nr:hypothetical protein [Ralstonia solanacearum]